MAAPRLREPTELEKIDIWDAIKDDDDKSLKNVLIKGIDVNARLGWRPLHIAAFNGSVKCASTLISTFNADINSTDEYGRTPLHVAIHKDHNGIVYLLIEEYNQQLSHLSQEDQDKALRMIEQYKKEHPEIIRNKLNQDIVDFMLQIREKGLTIKVRYGKVVLAGSSAAGKTSFFRLLMKREHCEKHISTGLAETQQVTIAMKALIQPSTQHDDVEFKALNFDDEISQLRSRLRRKLYTEPSLQKSRPVTRTSEVKSSRPQLLTEVETNIAANSEIEKLPQQPQPIEDVWNIITFIDTGGQPQFISMLPAVNNTAMITFVVHKMEGGAESLHNKVTVAHGNKHGEHSFMPYSTGQTNLDLIKSLMSFTNNIFSKKIPFLDKVCCKMGNSTTCLSFIGTHSDKTTKENISETDKIITTTVLDAQLNHVWMDLIANCTCLIPINNTTSGQENEDRNAAIIRNKLNQLLEEQSVYEVPIVWVLLELEIRKVCNSRNCSFIAYSEIIELCKEKQLSSDEEFIKNGLRFHHLFGVLLYFEEVEGMNNLVITDHQWLFDNLSKIVCHQYHNFSNPLVRTDFMHKGIFHKSLLDKVDLGTEGIKMLRIRETFDLKIAFLHLLNHLKIVAPLKETKESCTFFMPSLLSACNFHTNEQKFLEKYGTSNSRNNSGPYIVKPLLIQFTKSSMPDVHGTFPRGVFCCLAVQLLDKNPNWRLQWSRHEEVVFDNLITFSTETGHFITLKDKILFLEIQVRHKKSVDASTCCDIFNILCHSLSSIGQKLQFYDFKLVFGFACDCSKDCHVTRYSPGNEYSYCHYDEQTELTESHLIWFNNKKSPLLQSKLPMNVNINLKKIYDKYYKILVSSLPMKDVIFIAHLVKLLPGDLKGKVESKSTAAEAASCFLDNMIKPAVESGDNEPFEILLSELENSDYISLNNLAKGIRNEIHKALKAEPPTGRTGKMTDTSQNHPASSQATQQVTSATSTEPQGVEQPASHPSGQSRSRSSRRHPCILL